MSPRAITAAAAAVLALSARAAEVVFPARTGEAGMLDVPDASVVGSGRGLLGAELRLDHVSGTPTTGGPFPLYAVAGLHERLDVGLTMREWGQPGDPLPAKTSFGAAAKLQLLAGSGAIPAAALGLVLDRMNGSPVAGGRLIASTSAASALRFAAYLGGETRVDGGGESGLTYGAGVALALARGVESVVDGFGGPRGLDFGAAVRWSTSETLSFQAAVNYLPGEDGFRFSLGVGIQPAPRRRVEVAAPQPAPAGERAPEPAAFRDPRPRFRLRMQQPSALATTSRHLQHGSYSATVAAAGPARPGPSSVRGAAPSLDELAEAQLREQEALADTRERRIRATDEQLDEREKAAEGEQKRLSERERGLAEREQQLDAREKRLAPKGPPTQQQRQLESIEAQAAARERVLLGEERSLGPALDAARGRERDAAAREDAERREASRLAGSASGASSRALQLEIRKQALGARNRQLAAREARLVARGERIDALERQLRARSERVDAWHRRLEARAERLDLLERRAAEARAATAKAEAKPEGAAKDKAAFVMVVKSPTAIVKERAPAPAAGAVEPSLHPGVAVEKAVAAATIVTFPTTSTQLSELDREAIDAVAKLAAKERCELLIWARAKDPSLMGEAQRRAAELRTRVLSSGPLDSGQVVTRITTRPGAQGVDVVVSALREAAAPPAPAPAARAPTLLSGEGGKRQIREAVQAAQGSIEACVGELLTKRNVQRAEGALKITVASQGRVTKVLARDGDLGGTQLEECLDAASRRWLFPSADAEYSVDVPITVLRGGARR